MRPVSDRLRALRPAGSARLRAPRPWVLRTLVLTVVYGVAEALFVALRSYSPDLLRLWSILLLVLVAAVVIVWAGAEVILDRRPPEWTWFLAALVTAPAAGLLSWILLAVLVDDTGVADLQSALFGRASFTALLILATAVIGSRLGWLSLRRHGEGADDPMLDADDDAVAHQAALDRADVTPSPADDRAAAAARAAARVGVRPAAAAAGPSVAGVRTPGRRAPERAAGPEVAERERMPEAPRLARQRRASTVRSAGAGSSPRSGEPAASSTGPDSGPVSSPFGPAADAGRTARRRDADVPESLEPPVVAVLPQFPRPGGHRDPTGGQPVVDAGRDDEPGRGDADRGEPDQEGSRRRFGLRRPRS